MRVNRRILITTVLILIGISAVMYFFIANNDYANSGSNGKCKGSARCFYGEIEQIVDGDTFIISGETVRLTLVNTPEKDENGYESTKDLVGNVCPVGSNVLVDEDDLQISRSHRRVVATVYCGSDSGSKSLNEILLENYHAKILEDFCDRSEFANEEWVKQYGCD